MGFTHIYEYSPDGFNDTSVSQGCILEVAPSVGTVGGANIPKTGDRGKESLIAWVRLEGHLKFHPVNYLLQKVNIQSI